MSCHKIASKSIVTTPVGKENKTAVAIPLAFGCKMLHALQGNSKNNPHDLAPMFKNCHALRLCVKLLNNSLLCLTPAINNHQKLYNALVQLSSFNSRRLSFLFGMTLTKLISFYCKWFQPRSHIVVIMTITFYSQLP